MLPDPELLQTLNSLHRGLWEHRIKVTTGAFQKVSELGAFRRQIARIQTLLRERQISSKGSSLSLKERNA